MYSIRTHDPRSTDTFLVTKAQFDEGVLYTTEDGDVITVPWVKMSANVMGVYVRYPQGPALAASVWKVQREIERTRSVESDIMVRRIMREVRESELNPVVTSAIVGEVLDAIALSGLVLVNRPRLRAWFDVALGLEYPDDDADRQVETLTEGVILDTRRLVGIEADSLDEIEDF